MCPALRDQCPGFAFNARFSRTEAHVSPAEAAGSRSEAVILDQPIVRVARLRDILPRPPPSSYRDAMQFTIPHFLTCLWPGLAEIWWRGRFSAFPAAIAFAFALNWLLLTTFFYTGWVSGVVVRMACWIGVAAWGFYVVRRVRELPEMLAPRAVSEEPDRFSEAQAAYLRAEWDAAEELLQRVLAIEPRDPPALLLLAGVLRHTARYEAAELLTHEISRLEVTEAWHLELAAEMNRLQRAIEAAESDENGQKPADLTAA